MKRKEIEVSIPYFEKGEEKTKDFKIKFISRRSIKDYSDVMQHLMTLRNLSAERQRLTQEMGYVITEKKPIKERSEAFKEIKAKQVVIDDKIEQLSARDIGADTIAIVGRILSDNGIDEPDLLSTDFWEEHTEESDLWDFLNSVVYKDVKRQDSKKKESDMM